jgi:hypothetical protein
MNFPLPTERATTAAKAPGVGAGSWAGAPCARLQPDGTWVIAYRVRNGHDGIDETVIAVSEDGERLDTVATVDETRFDAMGMERPSLVRTEDGRWRLYTCMATKGSKHWWIDALEADTLEGLEDAEPRTVFAGNELTAVKDPLIRRFPGGWQAWVCVHPLDIDGAEDRITSVLPDGRAAYDGRATAEENWFERTGLTRLDGHRLKPEPVADVRYLDVVALPQGGHRIYYEARLEDESHELRTELIPAS